MTRLPGPHETLFIHPETDEYWYVPLRKEKRTNGSEYSTVQVSILGTFPPKEVQNDWTRASHQVLSSYTQSDTTGGGQIRFVDEATDGSRFWFANAWTAHPRIVTLPRKTSVAIEGLLGIVPLGDYQDDFLFSSNGAYPALPAALKTIDPSDDSVTDLDDFASNPLVQRGISFRGTDSDVRFFIPTTAGYEIWDGTALSGTISDADSGSGGSASIAPVAFALWDNNSKIYALDETGILWESTSGDAGTWTSEVQIDGSYTPLDLIEFYDRVDEPALHIICKEAVLAVDIANGKAYKTKVPPFRHPSDLRPATVFNTDLYVGGGVAIKKYTGQSIIPTGLDRDYGLPAEYRGEIKALEAFEDGVLALLELQTDTETNSALMWWNEDGWHTLWTGQGTELEGGAYRISVSGAGGHWRIYWGDLFHLYWQELDPYQFNPLEGVNETWEFEPSGYIEYGELDFAMTGVKKLIAWVEVRHRDVTEDETITIKYRLDGATSWTTLGTIDSQPSLGMTRLFLGQNGTLPDSAVRYDGVAANSIQLRAEFTRDPADATKRPIMESIGVIFHPLMGALQGYTFDVDGTMDTYKGHTAAEIHQFLSDMVRIGVLIPWYHGGRWHQVRFAGNQGWDEAGVDIKGDREVALLEVVDEFEAV